MSEPIVFISHFKVREGKLEGLRQYTQMMVEHIQADKPGTVAYLQYLNEEETELSIVHVFPDAEAYDRHLEGVGERAKGAFEFIEPIRRELYGMPNARALTISRPPDGSVMAFDHKPKRMDGYIRFRLGE
jgi:quinol monooxygenase YgiN